MPKKKGKITQGGTRKRRDITLQPPTGVVFFRQIICPSPVRLIPVSVDGARLQGRVLVERRAQVLASLLA